MTAIVVIAAALLTGCDQKMSSSLPAAGDAGSSSGQALRDAPDGALVAVVNGDPISEPLLAAFARGNGFDLADPTQRAHAIEQLEDTVLLAQQALKDGVVDSPDAKAEIALAHLAQLSARMATALRDRTQVPESDIRAYYEQEVTRAGPVEYHLEHILLASQEQALEAVAKANLPGADFDAIMGEYAAKGALQARDLGFVNRVQIPEGLAESAANLADGEVAPVPIQSKFGWHVLKRVESRPFTPPSYESIRNGAEKQLRQRALGDQIKALRAGAEIQAAAPVASPGNGGADQQ